MESYLAAFYESEREVSAFGSARNVLGQYDIRDSLAFRVNIDRLKDAGLYQEVYFHEYTHLQLSTSTTVGHALQFSAFLASEIEFFETLRQALMLLSFEAQEGAATLTQWYHRTLLDRDSKVGDFIGDLPLDYRDAFISFYNMNLVFLPDDAVILTPVFATALGQFCLNTGILKTLVTAFESPLEIKLQDYFDYVENHPEKRMRSLEHAALIDQDERPVRNESASRAFYEVGLRAGFDQIKREVPSVCGEDGSIEFTSQDGIYSQDSIAANDILCRNFNRAFHLIAGVPQLAFGATDVSEQYRLLLEITKQKLGLAIPHFDMSGNMNSRHSFRPAER